MSRDYVVRKATLGDLDEVKVLADAHKHELGFVLRPALSRSIARDEVLVAQNHTGVVGFVEYHHRRDNQTTLYHIAVASKHRGQGIGRDLIIALRREAKRLGKSLIRLKCPSDLPAQGFYAQMDFQVERELAGKTRRLVLWSLPVHEAEG